MQFEISFATRPKWSTGSDVAMSLSDWLSYPSLNKASFCNGGGMSIRDGGDVKFWSNVNASPYNNDASNVASHRYMNASPYNDDVSNALSPIILQRRRYVNPWRKVLRRCSQSEWIAIQRRRQ